MKIPRIPIQEKIERAIHSNQPFHTDRLEWSLAALSLAYRAAVRLRSLSYRRGLFNVRRLPCRVASVGNIHVGGTGKTPLTAYVAERLYKMGTTVAVVSRGYRGAAEKSGGIVSDGEEVFMDAGGAGDEPYMLATILKQFRIPVIVGRDRYRAGITAVDTFNPVVVLLDDAFQHRKLARDLDLVLLDRKLPFGNGHMLPRGPLREPPAALRRSDALITTGYAPIGDDRAAEFSSEIGSHLQISRPIFHCRYQPYLHGVFRPGCGGDFSTSSVDQPLGLAGKKVYGFSGIARNYAFENTLKNSGCRLVGFVGFPDHYRYSDSELRRILREAVAAGADWLSTTVKDFVRIAKRVPPSLPLAVIGVQLDFGDQTVVFDQFLAKRLRLGSRR